MLFGCINQPDLPEQVDEQEPQLQVDNTSLPEDIPETKDPEEPIVEDTSNEENTTVDNSTKPEPLEVHDIPQDVESNCLGFLTHQLSEVSIVSKVDGGWTRPHPGPFAWGFIETSPGVYDFSVTDKWVLIAQASNVTILATVWPYADWDQTCASNCEANTEDHFYPRVFGNEKQGIPLKRCKPCNMTAYKSFLSNLVERYDGDGINDMPDLKIPIKYWEISNEPSMQGGQLTFFKGTPAEYIEILKASNDAIADSCDDCYVVQGGSAGNHEQAAVFWEEVYSLGGGDYYDIANIHYISYGDGSTLNVREFKETMNKYGIDKPIWVTEVEYNSEDLTDAFDGALAAGASKLFFTGFYIGGKDKVKPSGPNVYSKEYADLAARCPYR